MPMVLSRFRCAMSSGTPLAKLAPKKALRVRLTALEAARVVKCEETHPAAMRSSLTELCRLWRHHCPAADVSKSRKSESTE